MTTLRETSYDDLLQVASFYSFTELSDDVITSLFDKVTNLANERQIKGIVLFALEGINGTICGSCEAVNSLLNLLEEPLFDFPLQIKYSWTPKQAFRRFKARRKAEIVTMGVEGINPSKLAGTYIEPNEWNDVIDDPETLIIDTRNDYEVAVGTFNRAINPHTDMFREFPEWVNNKLRPLVEQKQPKQIAMFCTGGIRCEKATSYLNKQGFKDVRHLHGGILSYLEQIPQTESRWQGECFVFDQRVALNHQLLPGTHLLCHACGMPLSVEDRMKNSYIRGSQCHLCKDRFTDQDRKRFVERQKQIDTLSKSFPNNLIWPNS